MKRLVFALLALALLLSGCAAGAPAVPEATPLATLPPMPPPTPAPTPVPTPEPLAPVQALLALQEHWQQQAVPSIAGFLPTGVFTEAGWQIFDAIEAERAWLPAVAEEIRRQLEVALQGAVQGLMLQYPGAELSVAQAVQGPNWQLIYALLRGAGSAEELEQLLAAALPLQASAELVNGRLELTASVAPLPYKEALALPGGGEAMFMGRCFTYSYCLTVYDENAMMQEYTQPEPFGSLAEGIVWPLASHTRLRKTWYADRDGGKRRHTGTDIWAAEGTEIYSCTAGTVTFVGYSGGMGNAVIVTDEFGYEFHYYHMVRLTDFLAVGDRVQAGQLIGHVGNTGNSSLDHLHLTIAAPDGLYVNPYPYLEAVEP